MKTFLQIRQVGQYGLYGLALMVVVLLGAYSNAQSPTFEAQQSSRTKGFGQSESFTDASLARYEQQLNAILRARLPEERAFVASVVRMVGEGELPRGVVNTSFAWIRKRRPYTNYPFFYFERVLRLQTSRLEIAIPPFDFSIYQRRR